MNERIKKLRKTLDLTQREFGERIGVKPNTIATYEIGRNEPIDAVISLICREFNASETWLRTGEGDMFAPEPAFDLSAYAKRHGMTALEMEILKAYLELGSDVREKLLQHFKERLAKTADLEAGKNLPAACERTEDGTAGQGQAEPGFEAEARVEAELFYQRRLQEKKQASQTSAANESGAG